MLDTVTDGIPVYMHSVYGLWCDPPIDFLCDVWDSGE